MTQDLDAVIAEIQEAFFSIVWFSYRRGFETKLAQSDWSTDSGWGCMLRTG
jgi:hypothetical protein